MAKNDIPKLPEAPAPRADIERIAPSATLARFVRAVELIALAAAASIKHNDALDRAVRELADEILADRSKGSP